MLSDRNTISEVAAHWKVSVKTVRRMIKRGAIPCLRLNGAIRIAREAVMACEAQCTSSGSTGTASGTSDLGLDSDAALARMLETARRQKFDSPGSLLPQTVSHPAIQ